MEVFIREPSSVVEVSANDTVAQLMKTVAQETGLEVAALSLDGTELPAEELCSGTALFEGCVLDLRVEMDINVLRREWSRCEHPTHLRAPPILLSDTTFMNTMLSRFGESGHMPASPLFRDHTFMICAVRRRPLYIRYAAGNDLNVAFEAISSVYWKTEYFRYLGALQSDVRVVLRAGRKVLWRADFVEMIPNAMREYADVALEIVKSTPAGTGYDGVPKCLHTHVGIVAAVVLRDASVFPSLSPELRTEDVVLCAVRSPKWDPAYFEHIPRHLLHIDRIIHNVACKDNWSCALFCNLPDTARGRLAIVLPFVRATPECMKHASREMRLNWEVVHAHVVNTPNAVGMDDVPSSLRDNIKVMTAVMHRDAGCLEHASSQIRMNADVVSAAVSSRTWSPPLIRFVENAVIARKLVSKLDPVFLSHSSTVLNDLSYVTTLIARDARYLQYAPHTLRADIKVLRTAMRSRTWHDSYLQYADETFFSCFDVMVGPIHRDARLLRNPALKELRHSRKIVLLAIESATWEASLLKHTSAELRADPKVVRKSLLKDGATVEIVDASFCDNTKLMLEAMKHSPSALQRLSPRLRADRGFVYRCATHDIGNFIHAAAALKRDKPFLRQLLIHSRDALLYTGSALCGEEGFIEECVAKYGSRLRLPLAVLKQRQEIAAAEKAADCPQHEDDYDGNATEDESNSSDESDIPEMSEETPELRALRFQAHYWD